MGNHRAKIASDTFPSLDVGPANLRIGIEQHKAMPPVFASLASVTQNCKAEPLSEGSKDRTANRTALAFTMTAHSFMRSYPVGPTQWMSETA